MILNYHSRLHLLSNRNAEILTDTKRILVDSESDEDKMDCGLENNYL